MDAADLANGAVEPNPSESYDWERAFRILGDLLASNGGSVSSTTLRRELQRSLDIEDARPLVVELQFFDPESSHERGIPTPNFRFHHLGRSFYSEEKYARELKTQEDATTREADDAGREASIAEPGEPATLRTNRQEEARLVAYVKRALEEIYTSDANSDDKPFVFDVHSARKGNSFENVDLLAVHWRPREICELVTAEVKLDFSPQAVQQALNYTRFSHRAWVAIRVDTVSNSELRERNPTLFEYTISSGLGILACRRRQGKSYEVFPVHWPLRHQPDPLEEAEFLERYRDEFEEAGIIEPRDRRRLPRLR